MNEWQVSIIYMVVFIVIIFLDAIGDALYDKHLKTLSGVIQTLLLTFFITCTCLVDADTLLWPITWEGVIWLMVGYVCLRYALFDFVYNVSRGLHPFYTGSTKLLDKFWRWWFRRTLIPPVSWFLVTRLLAFIFGLHAITNGIS